MCVTESSIQALYLFHVNNTTHPSKKNIGCYFVDDTSRSYGAGLNAGGGAVLVLQWEAEGLRIFESPFVFCLFVALLNLVLVRLRFSHDLGNFPRGYVPQDLEFGHPHPVQYLFPGYVSGVPSANFNRNIIPGTAYPSSGCPGNCTSQVMTGSNFVVEHHVANGMRCIIFIDGCSADGASFLQVQHDFPLTIRNALARILDEQCPRGGQGIKHVKKFCER